MNLAPPDLASTDVIAAVSVVLPWSTCPIVPTFTFGLTAGAEDEQRRELKDDEKFEGRIETLGTTALMRLRDGSLILPALTVV